MSGGNPYVHIETILSAAVVVEREGVTVGQALELIVEGLDAIKEEVHTLGPNPQVSDVTLNPGSWVHIELTSMGFVKVQTKRANVSQALKMIVAAVETLKKQARELGAQPALEALIGLEGPQN
jgi:hypothetical protein